MINGAGSKNGRAARQTAGGFSMTEMVITISIIGVLAGIAISSIGGTYNGSRDAIAQEKVETLNQALNAYAHAWKEYQFPPINGNFADELTVLLDLEYRDPNPDKALVGSPFLRPDYRPTGSTSVDDYRIEWTGLRFKLLKPGVAGAGIKIMFDGSDYTTPFAYPPNYSSSGR